MCFEMTFYHACGHRLSRNIHPCGINEKLQEARRNANLYSDEVDHFADPKSCATFRSKEDKTLFKCKKCEKKEKKEKKEKDEKDEKEKSTEVKDELVKEWMMSFA